MQYCSFLSAISAMPNINTTQSAVKCQANQAEKSEPSVIVALLLVSHQLDEVEFGWQVYQLMIAAVVVQSQKKLIIA